jgi:hypothetical protein
MTWKSYAVMSGATVLAGWLASSPPANAPETAGTTASPQPASRRGEGVADIAREAERLQVRLRREVAYGEPQRNPFRFGSARPPRARAGGDLPVSADVAETAPVADVPDAPPPPPQLTLSGIAEDQDGDRTVRTAILSSPSGVLLVHEGDLVLGRYRVAGIESGAVSLVSLTDGTTLRVALRP